MQSERAGLRVCLFFFAEWWGSPSASRLRSCGGVRAGGCHPRGHDSGDPLRKGRPKAAVYLLPYGPGRRPTGGFRRDSCRAKTAGLPWPAPCGLFPVVRLAYATGPEGDTRRLFRILRCVGSSAPLAIPRVTALSDATRHRAHRCKGSATRAPPARTPLTRCLAGTTTAHHALPIMIASGALPSTNRAMGKSRRVPVPPSGPVAQARASTGQGPKGADLDGRPFPRRQDADSETPSRSPTRPAGP
jgi:hypothetical protein